MLSWIKRLLLSTKRQKRRKESVKLLREFSRIIGHRFRYPKLLVQSLKHRSYLPQVNEDRTCSNERLELLGDAVLGLVVTEQLFRAHPEREEGQITAAKSLLVSRKILTRIARKLNIGKYILMSESEERSGGRERPSIIADAYEAIVGAIYLDGGLEMARDFIRRSLLIESDEILGEEQHRNFKSILLELTQSRSLGTPSYNVLSEQGPDHNKLFTVEVMIREHRLGIGVGNSKKRAEQRAAQEALAQLAFAPPLFDEQ